VKTYPHQQLQTDFGTHLSFPRGLVGNTTYHLRYMPKMQEKKENKKPRKGKGESSPLSTNHRAPGPWCTELSRPYPCGGARVGLYISHQRPGCPHPRIAPARSAFSSPASDLPLAALTAALPASSPPSPRARHLACSLHVARAPI
jgi:hypothetical protein